MSSNIEYRILNLYRTRRYDECVMLCSEAAQSSEKWVEWIRLRVLTLQVKVAGEDYEEVEYGANESQLTSTALAKTPRPGTSFQGTATAKTASYTASRATTGPVRTALSRGGRSAMATAARAATALATGSAPAAPALTLAGCDTAAFYLTAKTTFEYIFFYEGDVRKAMEIALQAQKENTTDWYWNYSLSKCYSALGMHRNAEECLRKGLSQSSHLMLYLRLIAMYVGLRQPISALDVCRQGLMSLPNDTNLMTETARLHEAMGNSMLAIREYRSVAIQDPCNVEAIANIALYNFYNDQPEIALRYYRRLLAMSAPSAELYNNVGLCCLYCNQWDLALPCFRNALFLSASAATSADIWFNMSHVALSTGDLVLARRCLEISLALQSSHSEALASLNKLNAFLQQKNPQATG